MRTRWSRFGSLVLPFRRATFIVFYVLLATAGFLTFFFPSRSVVDAMPYWAVYVWASFYLLGGLLCALGAVTRLVAGEVVGLPLVASASGIYGTALLLQFGHIPDGAYLVVGCLLLTQMLGLADRWLGVMLLLRRSEIGE